jgi:hypothetical protein
MVPNELKDTGGRKKLFISLPGTQFLTRSFNLRHNRGSKCAQKCNSSPSLKHKTMNLWCFSFKINSISSFTEMSARSGYHRHCYCGHRRDTGARGNGSSRYWHWCFSVFIFAIEVQMKVLVLLYWLSLLVLCHHVIYHIRWSAKSPWLAKFKLNGK